jgi:Holliday junction resolvase
MVIIEAGLSPELEFIAAVNWLGRTLTVNRIDQTPLHRYHDGGPESRVPDILSIASIDGNSVPLLIEVKKSAKDPMKWSDKYLSGLRVYADTLKLPLLIAWKYHHMWTLTDTHHFEKKVQAHHLSFEKAACENLMSQVFGDLMIVLTQRVALFIDGEVTSEAPLPPLPKLLPAGDHTLTIRDAGFLLARQQAI